MSPVAAVAASAEDLEVFADVEISKIDPDPHNVRGQLGDLAGLTASIKESGVLQPVIVAVVRKGRTVRYRLIAGHRRVAAAKKAGLKTIPAMLRHGLSDVELLEEQMTENLQRSDLTVLDEARGFQRLVDHGRSQRAIAAKFGCGQAHVSKRLSLLGLPEIDRAALDAGTITVGEALELVKLVDHRDAYRRARSACGVPDLFRKTVRLALEEISWGPAVELANREAAERGIPVVKWPTSGWYSAKFIAHAGQEDLCTKPLGHAEHVLQTYQLADYPISACDPSHLAVAISPNGTPVTVCTDPKAHEEASPTAARRGSRNRDVERHQARTAAAKRTGKAIKAAITEVADPIAGDTLRNELVIAVAEIPEPVRPVLELLALDTLNRGGLQHTAKRMGIEPVKNGSWDDWRAGVLAWADLVPGPGRLVRLLTVAITHAAFTVASEVGSSGNLTTLENFHAAPSVNALYDLLLAHGHEASADERSILAQVRGDIDTAAAS